MAHKLINRINNNVILLQAGALIWVAGCFLMLYMAAGEAVKSFAPAFWGAEISILVIAIAYSLWGISTTGRREAVAMETYRLYGMIVLSLATLDVGVRMAGNGEAIGLILLLYASVLASVGLMMKIPARIMSKMQNARSKGWLGDRLDEEAWTWDASVHTDLDGPAGERERATTIHLLDRLHYVMPGIASLTTFLLGNTQAIKIAGWVLIFLSIGFMKEVARKSGEIQQLKKWEAAKGRLLITPSHRRHADRAREDEG